MLTWHPKAGDCLATLAGAGPDVDHTRLLALGTVSGLLLAPVCKVGLGPPTEALAGGRSHIDHVISLAPVPNCTNTVSGKLEYKQHMSMPLICCCMV